MSGHTPRANAADVILVNTQALEEGVKEGVKQGVTDGVKQVVTDGVKKVGGERRSQKAFSSIHQGLTNLLPHQVASHM